MNQHEPPQPSRGVRRAWHCLSLLLLPTIAIHGVHALPVRRTAGSGPAGKGAAPTPYLPVTGAPPLRFHEPPPPDLVMRPPAAAPPTPALTPTESSVAAANAAAAQSATVSAEPTPAAPAPEPAPVIDPGKPSETVAPPVKTPPPILRDDTRPAVRPEDFLPYFQIPGAAQHPADVTLLVPAPRNAPAPAPLPPSSATYRQTPR